MTKAYAIAEWLQYEPTARENAGQGPLRYVKSRVHGHDLGVGFRKLMKVGNGDGMAAFGFFMKLLELAADEPRQRRNGVIYLQGKPADIGDIAFLLDIDESDAGRWMDILLSVRWVELDEPATFARQEDDGSCQGTDMVRQNGDVGRHEAFGDTSCGRRQAPGTQGHGRRDTSPNGTGNGTGHNGTEHNGTEQESGGGGTVISCSGSGLADIAVLKLADEMCVPAVHADDDSPRARQAKADHITIRKIVGAVCVGDAGKQKAATAKLLEMARETRHKRKRMAALVAKAKEGWVEVRDLWP